MGRVLNKVFYGEAPPEAQTLTLFLKYTSFIKMAPFHIPRVESGAKLAPFLDLSYTSRLSQNNRD